MRLTGRLFRPCVLLTQRRIMSSSSCCPTDAKPIVNDYKGTGKHVTIKDHFDMYVAAPPAGTSTAGGVMQIYDIFGASGHTEQFADRLAEAGNFVVCVPDFMVGEAWPAENIPPTKTGKFPPGVEPADGVEVLMGWVMNHRNCRFDRTESIRAVKEYLQQEYKITKFGAAGNCWGAKVAFTVANKEPDLIDAVAACHGSLLTKEDVQAVNVPMCFLNSKDEPESYATDIKPILESKSPDNNVFKDFPKMHHGWMGTRGTGASTDFTNQEMVEGFREGISDLSAFFTKSFAK